MATSAASFPAMAMALRPGALAGRARSVSHSGARRT